MDCRLQAFGGLRGSPFTSLWWQMESFTSLWGRTSIIVYKHLVADGALYKPLVEYVDRRLQAFGSLRGSPFTSIRWQMESFTSLWWHTWVVVYMPLVAYVNCLLQALGGRWSHLQAFRGIRCTSCTCL